MVLVAGGGAKDEGRAATTPAPVPDDRPSRPGAPQVVEADGELAVGITEQNPNLIWPAAGPEGVPAVERWRRAMDGIRPGYLRIVLRWSGLQPGPARPADLELPQGGCLRDVPPCVGWIGVRDQLRAAAARQKATGMQVHVVVYGSPGWAARPARGCETGGTGPSSRPPRSDALPAYERLVTDTLKLAEREGVELRYWSPWNEPNHPYFLSPQRPRCSGRAPSASVARYVELSRALEDALQAAPGDQEIVLGELSGLYGRKPRSTGVTEFIRGLPRALVCEAAVVSQHGYVGGRDPVAAVSRGLATHGCPRTPEIWITETGVGAPRRDAVKVSGAEAERAACRAMHAQLVGWYEDPRVTAAFQYTLREDDRFATGLVDVALRRPFPVLRAWQAWGGGRAPAGPPPSAAAACA